MCVLGGKERSSAEERWGLGQGWDSEMVSVVGALGLCQQGGWGEEVAGPVKDIWAGSLRMGLKQG